MSQEQCLEQYDVIVFGKGITALCAALFAPYGNWCGCHAIGWDFNYSSGAGLVSRAVSGAL